MHLSQWKSNVKPRLFAVPHLLNSSAPLSYCGVGNLSPETFSPWILPTFYQFYLVSPLTKHWIQCKKAVMKSISHECLACVSRLHSAGKFPRRTCEYLSISENEGKYWNPIRVCSSFILELCLKSNGKLLIYEINYGMRKQRCWIKPKIYRGLCYGFDDLIRVRGDVLKWSRRLRARVVAIQHHCRGVPLMAL